MVTWGTVVGLAYLAGLIGFSNIIAAAPVAPASYDPPLPDSAIEPAGL